MTLKSLFSKTFWIRLLRRLSQFNWLTALWSVVLFFAFPVAGALIFSVNLVRENYWTVARVNNTITGQLMFVCIATMFVAILTPNVFNYLNSRKQLDFYHSQPVTRKELFWRNYTVGWLSYIMPLTAGFLSEAGIIMLLPGIAWENTLLLLKGYLACLGTYFSVNALCVLAVMVCGNRFISMLTGVYFCGAPAMIFGMFWYYVDSFSATFAYSGQMYDILGGITPVSYLLDMVAFEEDGVFNEAFWWTVGWTVVSAGIVFLARALYLRRKSETAGKPLSFARAIIFIKYPLTVFAAWGGGILFEAMGDENVIWLLFGFITLGIITWCIISGLEKFEFRNAFRGWLKLLLCGGIFVSCLLTLFAGTFAFDKRTTKDANILSIDLMTIYYNESKDGGTCYNCYYSLEGIEGEEAIHVLNTIIKEGASSAFTGGNVRLGGNYAEVLDDHENDTARISVQVRIHTKFGSYTRYYGFNCEPRGDMLKAVKEFSTSKGAKKAFAEHALAQIDTNASHFVFRPSAELPSSEKMEQVYKALAEDIKNASVEDYGEKPVGAVNILYSARFYSYGESERRETAVPVYPSFEKTLALVSEGGLMPLTDDTVGEFSSSEYNYYDEDDYANGYKDGEAAGYEKGKATGFDKLPYELPDLKELQYSESNYDRGYYKGFIQGYEQGFSIYGDPYEEGYNKGYEDGYSAGVSDKENGFDYTSPTYEYDGTSYSDGYYNGYCDGYNAGYYKE